jgi:hypothetical protein
MIAAARQHLAEPGLSGIQRRFWQDTLMDTKAVLRDLIVRDIARAEEALADPALSSPIKANWEMTLRELRKKLSP